MRQGPLSVSKAAATVSTATIPTSWTAEPQSWGSTRPASQPDAVPLGSAARPASVSTLLRLADWNRGGSGHRRLTQTATAPSSGGAETRLNPLSTTHHEGTA